MPSHAARVGTRARLMLHQRAVYRNNVPKGILVLQVVEDFLYAPIEDLAKGRQLVDEVLVLFDFVEKSPAQMNLVVGRDFELRIQGVHVDFLNKLARIQKGRAFQVFGQLDETRHLKQSRNRFSFTKSRNLHFFQFLSSIKNYHNSQVY
jgi:hypothetical protein